MLDMLSVHKELEASILKDITRRILKSGFVTDTASYQAEKLNEAGLCYNEILDEISTRTKKCREEIKKSFSDAETKVFDYDESVLANAGINAHEFKKISPRMKRIITAALAKTATDAVNLTKTTANTTQSLYISACDLAHMQVMSGAFDYNTAVKNAVTHAAREGIKVVYPTGAVSSLDTAVRRSVLTGVNQTFAKITEMRAKEFDVDLMLTSTHIGARPEHAVWQGYVVSLSGRDGYLTLSDVGYGDVRGIFGANCRHSWNMFFEGASHMQYTEAQLEEMRSATCKYDGKEFKIYEARDKQRAMERGIKSTKRKLICFDEAIKNAPDEKAKAEFKNEFANLSVKLKKQEAKLNDFTYQTGLKRDRVREQVYAEETKNGIKNFGKSVSQKAVWENKKELDKYTKYHYNEDGSIVVTDRLKRVSTKYKPFAVVDIETKKGGITRNIYDADGIQVKQISNNNHGNSKLHPFGNNGEHAHDYCVDEAGNVRHFKGRELTETERKENKDIL